MYRLSFKQLGVLSVLLLFFGTKMSAQVIAPTPSAHFEYKEFSHRNPCKVFIGVGTSTVSEGLKVDYTVENTPASESGVLAGDVILSMDGVALRTQSELLNVRDKHQQGEAFTLKVLRNGAEKTIQARFKTCSEAELEAAEAKKEARMMEMEFRMEEIHSLINESFKGFEMKERAILGVYENTEVNGEGLVISSVVTGKGAEAAGLRSGDVVVMVDGKKVTGSGTLRSALNDHKPGDQVKRKYLRDGQTFETVSTLSADRYSFTQKVEREPCKVFIGVYTSGHALEGRGLRVTGVIDGTPAKESDIQPGDIILAFNNQPVNNHQELTGKRDQKKPGDAFSLTVLREGNTLEIDARFKACETSNNEPTQETVEVLNADREAPQDLDNTLKLDVFEAFPSPTYGTLNIQFEAEAVPTTVRIFDASGRAVYSKELPQFGGSFMEQANLSGNNAGNYVLSIQQGNKVRSKQIVLLPRA